MPASAEPRHRWLTGPAADSRGEPVPLAAAADLVEAVSAAAPGASLLRALNQCLRVDHLSIVRYPARGAAPVLVEGLSLGPRNITPLCFERYRSAFWRFDPNTHLAERLNAASSLHTEPQVAALHLEPQQIPDPTWRHDIYERERLADRLSLVYCLAPQQVVGLHLYRHDRHGRFDSVEVDRLLALAPLLRQVHVLSGRNGQPLGPERAGATDPRWPAVWARLSPREREVCGAIARGISADGIAEQLGIAPSSVHTLRRRAYAKLAAAGLHGGRLALLRAGLRTCLPG